MFEELLGLPAHPLLVHVPVVLVPLLALTAAAYALVDRIRPHVRWVLGLLAVAAGIGTLLAKLSGDAFFERMDTAGRITPGFYPTIEAHQTLGTLTLWATGVLAVLTLALVYFVPPGTGTGAAGSTRTRVLVLSLRVATVLAAAVALYYVIRTGDSGANAVWSEY